MNQKVNKIYLSILEENKLINKIIDQEGFTNIKIPRDFEKEAAELLKK